jgi:hypothetical protein
MMPRLWIVLQRSLHLSKEKRRMDTQRFPIIVLIRISVLKQISYFLDDLNGIKGWRFAMVGYADWIAVADASRVASYPTFSRHHSWPRGYDQKKFHVQFMGFKYSLISIKSNGIC